MTDDLKVAIVHDYLTQRGGAERVVVAMLDVFPDARLVTSVYDADATYPEFRSRQVETTLLHSVKAFRKDPRRALPLLPRVFSRYPLHDVDVVLCSSSGFAHGIATTAPKVVYCHNPPRWVYQPDDYLTSRPARSVFRTVTPVLRYWDQRASADAFSYLVNSSVVQQRVADAYDRKAAILPPPVSVDTAAARDPIEGLAPGFLLTIGRSRGYKNTAEVARAMHDLPDERLVVVGGLPVDGGPWPSNVIELGRVSDAQLRWLYANAASLVAISREDFGLTPIEAYSFGTPALVLRGGGYLDTTEPGLSGHFIEGEAAADVVAAVRKFRHSPALDAGAIVQHAERWSKERFAADLRQAVQEAAESAKARQAVPEPRLLRVVHAERRSLNQTVTHERRGARHEGE